MRNTLKLEEWKVRSLLMVPRKLFVYYLEKNAWLLHEYPTSIVACNGHIWYEMDLLGGSPIPSKCLKAGCSPQSGHILRAHTQLLNRSRSDWWFYIPHCLRNWIPSYIKFYIYIYIDIYIYLHIYIYKHSHFPFLVSCADRFSQIKQSLNKNNRWGCYRRYPDLLKKGVSYSTSRHTWKLNNCPCP